MPLRLDIKKKLSQRTDRVKSVDISTAEPWVLIGLYTGHLQIWNYDVSQQPCVCPLVLLVSFQLLVVAVVVGIQVTAFPWESWW